MTASANCGAGREADAVLQASVRLALEGKAIPYRLITHQKRRRYRNERIGMGANTVIIASDAIDIAVDDTVQLGRALPYVFLQPESGTADDLVTINGAKFMQQGLWIRGVNDTVTITIKNSGNIRTIDGTDFDIVGKNYVRFVYDIADEKWVQQTTGAAGAGGGGFSGLWSDITIDVDKDMNDKTISNVKTLSFNRPATGFGTASGLELSTGIADSFQFLFGGIPQYTMTDTSINLLGNKLLQVGVTDFNEQSTVPSPLLNTAKLYAREDAADGNIAKMYYVDSAGNEVGPLGGGFSGLWSDITIDVITKDMQASSLTNLAGITMSGAAATIADVVNINFVTAGIPSTRLQQSA